MFHSFSLERIAASSAPPRFQPYKATPPLFLVRRLSITFVLWSSSTPPLFLLSAFSFTPTHTPHLLSLPVFSHPCLSLVPFSSPSLLTRRLHSPGRSQIASPAFDVVTVLLSPTPLFRVVPPMSVATVTSPPPPPSANPLMNLPTSDPVVATGAINPSDDPFANFIRSSLSSRPPPPRALSPRIYGRSPRLPSALPLSASPQLVEPVTPDRQTVFPLFAADEGIDLPQTRIEEAVDLASESERQSRVEGRLRWARSLPPFQSQLCKTDDVVDDDDAAKLFMSVPRKYPSGSSVPPLPTMNVPDFLHPPEPNRPSSSPTASTSNPRCSAMSLANTSNHSLNNNNGENNLRLPTNPDNDNTATIVDNQNNNVPTTSIEAPTRRFLPRGITASQPDTLLNDVSDKMQTEVPILQLPELAPIRHQPLVEAGPWDTSFVRSPNFTPSLGGLGGVFSRDPFHDAVKGEMKTEIKLELTETPMLSLPMTSVGNEVEHMVISRPSTKRPLPIQTPEVNRVKGRRSQGHKPPTHPTRRVDPSESPCCNICGTKFARKSNLNKHLRSVHEDVRKFPCELCSLKFKRQDHLIKHKRSVHAKLRKFTCDLCGIGFAEKFNRDKHRRNIHNNKRAFQCGCGAYFQDREKMLNCLKCKQLKQTSITFWWLFIDHAYIAGTSSKKEMTEPPLCSFDVDIRFKDVGQLSQANEYTFLIFTEAKTAVNFFNRDVMKIQPGTCCTCIPERSGFRQWCQKRRYTFWSLEEDVGTWRKQTSCYCVQAESTLNWFAPEEMWKALQWRGPSLVSTSSLTRLPTFSFLTEQFKVIMVSFIKGGWESGSNPISFLRYSTPV